MIQIGVIGYGYWGPNLVRNFSGAAGARVAAVSDLRPERLALVQERYPAVKTFTDHAEMLRDPAVDAVAVATPVATHFELAMQALRAGKHVLVEKPMTATSNQGLRLLEEAEKRNLVLMVDHTFLYTGAVRKIKELVDDGSLGELYYFDSTRVNLGLFQRDVNVVYDLAVHDVSILDFLLDGRTPKAVSATGVSHVPGKPENIAFLSLFYDANFIGHLNVNWLSPVKIRQTLVAGAKKMVVYNDLEINEKVKVYDAGVTCSAHPDKIYELMVDYRVGDVWSPNFDRTEALRVEADHFARCVEGKEKPLTDGRMGLRIVRVLEAASDSLARQGRLVEIKVD